MSMSPKSLFKLPGFRFHPTEEELVSFYLERKVQGDLNIPPSLIQDVNFYQFDPWELSDMLASSQQQEHVYMFVPRDRKYANGSRPNRVASSGYWKATGTDKRVTNWKGKCIGLKKTLVFYRGRAPKGAKTEWIMNEFRLPRTDSLEHSVPKELDVTLCRLYRKHSIATSAASQVNAPPAAMTVCNSKNTFGSPALSSISGGTGVVETANDDSLEAVRLWLLEDIEVESCFQSNESWSFLGGLFSPTSSSLDNHLKSQALFSTAP